MHLEPSVAEQNAFLMSMQPRWDWIVTELAADCPPDWSGYRFHAGVEPDEAGFTISCGYQDHSSNRRRNVPQALVDKLGRLHVESRNFWPPLAWRKVTVNRHWMQTEKQWKAEIVFSLG